MARLVAAARPAETDPATPDPASVSPFLLPSLAVLTARTRLAPIGLYIDMLRLRRPWLFWGAAVSMGVALALTLSGRAAGMTDATGARSALDSLGAAATAPPAGADTGGASSLLGGSIDPIDLIVKGGVVVVLLFVTLRVLGRVQGGRVPADARIRVIESRTLGAKTQLHLVAVGDRQVLIGATPGRLVTLAELPADETTAPFAASPAADLPASIDVERVGSNFAAALGLARAGADR